ncbi:very short patch repair endonuclease [Shinella fusca]|uniref:very short patch repair endonuclease n=1 Tax=Shinella fusca TaxID=544480 RepID=UPI001609766D|nr:DNA mismatch endonuclease Vsr [Shinella fusca]
MADRISPAQRSANMSRIKGRDTRPELHVRHLLHALGYRYVLHMAGLPGTPDIIFSKRRKVIFVHGCFWHQHDGCRNARIPKSNTIFWEAKLSRNVERDQQNLEKLSELGWGVLIIWECEIDKHAHTRDKITRFLGPPRLGS